MKRMRIWLVAAVFLLFGISCSSTPKTPPAQAEETVTLSDLPAARDIYENTRYISNEELWETDHLLDEGLTVVYGFGLDDSFIEFFIDRPAKNGVDGVCPLPQFGGIRTNIYMVLCFKSGDAMDIQYIGVSCEEEVSDKTEARFVAANLTADAMDRAVITFINRLAETEDSALYRPDKATLAESSAVCAYLYDTITHLALYGEQEEACPVAVYRQDTVYEAFSRLDSIEHSDTYYLRARVTVTPGSCLAVPEGLYNAEYGEKIRIRGVKASFDNVHAEVGDHYVHLDPFGVSENVSGKKFECCGETFAFESPDSFAKIGQNARFDSDGESYVEFLADRQNRISSAPFSYAAEMYMESGGEVLLTRIAAGVTYRLGGEDRFAESEREIFFSKS